MRRDGTQTLDTIPKRPSMFNGYIVYGRKLSVQHGMEVHIKRYTLKLVENDNRCVHLHENDPWIRASQALLDSNFSINLAFGVADPEPLGEGDIVPS